MRNAQLLVLLWIVAAGALFSLHTLHSTSQDHVIQKVPKKDRIEKAIEQEFEMTKDPALGFVPRDRLLAAKNYVEKLRAEQAQTRAAIGGITWTERGPNNVSGRTRAILIDANDATGNTVWAGSVGGGLWKTTNGGTSWTSINDLFGNLAVSCIAQDPSNAQTLYFGTGEGWFNADAIRGLGIWKSTDGGNTWNQLASTNNSTFHYVQKIVVDGAGNVLACTRNGGIQRSANGGSSWSKVLGSGAGASTNRAADIEIASDGDMYASMGIFSTDGIYKSTNGGTAWTKLTGGLPSSGYYRIELACAPNNASRVYALYQGTNYDCSGIYRTDNDGSSWTSLPVPSAYGMSNFCRGQAWYDLICAVDPNNSSRVFIGGIDLLVSNNAGSSWSQISQWYGGGGYQYVHADQHAIVFQPGNSNLIWFGNDGGAYRTTNGSAGTPTISFRGTGYNVTQYYAADLNPNSSSSEFLAGSQDNGTQRYTSPGMNNTTEVTGGDGAFCHIDRTSPNIQVSSYVYNNYYITTNNWGSYTSRSIGSNAGRFINPTDYDNDANILYACYNSGTYSYISGVGSTNSTGSRSIGAFNNAQVSAVTVSPNVSNRVYFGLDNGDVVRVDNAHSSSASGTVIRAGSGYVSCVAVEEGNENHLLVTYSNYGVNSIYESTNGGSSWASVEGNVPDMPVRWIMFDPGNGDQALIATELGVWSTDNLNGSSTNWGPTNGGLANVRTDMLQYRTSDRTVIAATHGRGLFSAVLPGGGGGGPSCNTTISSYPYAESFESGLGDWSQDTGDDIDWTRNSGGTPSSGTGPSGASAGSWYMYVETSSPNYPSKTAIFNSPCFDLTSLTTPELTFDYHMLGNAVGTLVLEASTDGANWTSIWSRSGSQGSAWNPGTVDLSAYVSETALRLRFVGTSGSSWQGDLCVDNLGIDNSSGGGGGPNCGTTITVYPYAESFESGLGDWSQDTGDDLDWTRRSGSTPSSGTGPSGASAGSWYMYVETSSPNYPSKTAIFNSPCFDLTSLSSPELTFDYHMLGNAVGSLALEASTDGNSWTSIWSRSGSQGSNWNAGSVDLAAYAGSTVLLRFVGTSGSSWQGDLCIDNLNLDEAGAPPTCPAINFNNYTINPYGSGQDNGSYQVQDGGATLFIQNNAWKSISYNYTITANTVIEFDFQSTLQGEIHGIGFDDDDAISSNLTFKVHGTQNWGITNYDNYPGSGWVTYTIPVGSFYTGSANRIVFVADHDSSPGNGNSYFRNLKVYEGSCGTVADPLFSDNEHVEVVMGDEEELAWQMVQLFPNPFVDRLVVKLPEGLIGATFEMVDMYGRRVFYQQQLDGRNVLDLGHRLSSGVYVVRITYGDERKEYKVVRQR